MKFRFSLSPTISTLILALSGLLLASLPAAATEATSGEKKPRSARLMQTLPSCAVTTPLTVDSPVNGSLQSGDCAFGDGVLFDRYSFSGTTGQTISIPMSSTAFDTQLYLYNAAGDLLQENDDSVPPSTNSRIPAEDGVFVLPSTGTYYVIATSFDVATGNYSLSLNSGTGCTTSPITPGVTVSGAIAATDCKVNGGGNIYYTDFYTFSGTAGQSFAITMTSSSQSLDPYLILRTPSGAGSQEDDNSGGGTAARIPTTGFFTLTETGTYIIEVSGYDPLETGSYSLSLVSGECTYSLSPTSASIAGSGGTGSVAVTSQAGCNWTATSNDTWITVTSGSPGSGSASFSYSVSLNSGASRSGTISVSGQTFTVNQSSATGSISGTVRYYFGTSPVAVPGVTLTAAGTPQVTATTDASGAYSLTGLGGGAYTVTPSRTGGVNGLNSLDASRVAQYAAGLLTLTANQLIAADASGNGAVNSFDASRIAQTVVGIPNTGIAGTWKFVPASKTYTTTSTNTTGEDYAAIMVGDVTGNWTNPPAAADLAAADAPYSEPSSAVSADSAKTSLGVASEGRVDIIIPERRNLLPGEVVRIPVRIGDVTGRNITAFDFEVSFDSAKLRLVGVDGLSSLSSNFSVFSNAGVEGRLRVSAFGVTPLHGEGDLLYLTFETVGSRGGGSIKWENFVFNEGEVPVKTKAGFLRQRRSLR